ncbi:hypothetical protein BHE74_00056505 [Ensete ventricosum]|nr:hypothetical protein BHE74_00056505 [Ensete ventricosum]RZS25243.1 hypothetical protein BHM03_00058418 [Ensete ventricosum]
MGVERETSTRTGSHQNPAVPQEKDHASGTEHTPRFYRRIDQLARNPQTKKKRQNKATPLRVLAVDERAKSNSGGRTPHEAHLLLLPTKHCNSPLRIRPRFLDVTVQTAGSRDTGF